VNGFADQMGVAADHVTADDHLSMTDDHVSVVVADF